MVVKRLLCPERVRRLPARFSWVDQRLVRDRHIERCDAKAAALYLMLVTVGDAQGLSYYSDAALSRCLSIEPERLIEARADLIRLGLVAFEQPLYQVLALDPAPAAGCELSVEELRVRWRRLRASLGKER